MKYPSHDPTILDTGIRKLDIVALFGPDAQAAGGTHAVTLLRLTRRADAITTEGDIWTNDDPTEYEVVGDADGCIAYISAQPIPKNGRILYNAPGKTIWVEIKEELDYIKSIRSRCDLGETLALELNYAAALKNGYAPYAPLYDPKKRPVI